MNGWLVFLVIVRYRECARQAGRAAWTHYSMQHRAEETHDA